MYIHIRLISSHFVSYVYMYTYIHTCIHTYQVLSERLAAGRDSGSKDSVIVAVDVQAIRHIEGVEQVCMYVCVYVYMYVYACIAVHVQSIRHMEGVEQVCMYVCVYICRVCMHACMHVCICKYYG